MGKSIFAVLLMAISFSSFSQRKQFDNDYVVFFCGDTLHGQIQKASNILLSQGIKFKENCKSDSVISYAPYDVTEFCISDKQKKYRSVNFESRREGNKETIRRFGELLFSDQIDLYKLYLSDDEINYTHKSRKKNFAYVMQVDTVFYTLSQYEIVRQNQESAWFGKQEFKNTRTYSMLKKEYIGVLNYVFNDCPKINRSIAKVNFYDSDIIGIIKKYIECKKSKK